ncbi:MAG: thioredoxin domain-containing protein [Anaerolineae bacterium]|nr:thioredoxin domain-containing protein [Anaerolineae bacterium]
MSEQKTNHEHTNRLIHETSPYLLQHAHNPVDWYAWGEEALAKSRAEDKPILLSIGYSACHWCHVMERESFENEAIATLMNKNFVCIKVDREERPDLDSIYMTAVQSMTGNGGWPMTVFLMPDGSPFYGGTYYPPTDRMGMPGFGRVLMAVADAYRNRRKDVTSSAGQLREMLRAEPLARAGREALTPALLEQAFHTQAQNFDPEHGGFGSAPKFPQPMNLEFLLRTWRRLGWSQALVMTERTLEKMARGGMYDQVGGGFHRYSTDRIWLVPHFEKMLYDNALLARVYLHAYQATGNALYRRISEETLDYVRREMTAPDSGFYSTQDADSEGEEGKFFVWTPEEITGLLGSEDGRLFSAYYGVTPEGNFEGKNILHVPKDEDVVAYLEGVSVERLRQAVERGRRILFAAREERVHPGRDNKILTGWNGLTLAAFAEAALALGRDDYRQTAARAASFLLTTLRRPEDGRLLRTYKEGRVKLLGYLEDYAALADALILLHQATAELRWLAEARALADAMLALFWDEENGGFYDTGKDHEELVARPRDFFDNATPAGNSLAVDVLLRLAVLYGEPEYRRRAVAMLERLSAPMANYPGGFGHLLGALDFHLSRPKEIVVVGPASDPATLALRAEVARRYIPNKVFIAADSSAPDGFAQNPLLEGKTLVKGRPAAYVCQNYECQLPVTEPEELARQL